MRDNRESIVAVEGPMICRAKVPEVDAGERGKGWGGVREKSGRADGSRDDLQRWDVICIPHHLRRFYDMVLTRSPSQVPGRTLFSPRR